MVIPLVLYMLSSSSLSLSSETYRDAHICIHADKLGENFSILSALETQKELKTIQAYNRIFCDRQDLNKPFYDLCRNYISEPNNGCIQISSFGDQSQNDDAIPSLSRTVCAVDECFNDVTEVSRKPTSYLSSIEAVSFQSGVIYSQDPTSLLIQAILEGACEVARLLIQQGADYTIFVQDKPLIYHALERGHIRCVELLFGAFMAANQE